MSHQPVRIAIIGMGGFAGAHHTAAHVLEQRGECRVVSGCDPQPEAFRAQRERWEFEARGIRVYTDYRDMLAAHAHELDAVTVPTPVPLHAEMHRAAIERGLACYLEKPPSLDPVELEEMLAVEAHATRATQVGFSHIVEPERQVMKERLVNGEFGALRRATFLGMAPRATTYFARAAWSGRLMMGDRLVLDSALGNAVAHHLHNLLFWAGSKALFDWATVASVRAELYRAHVIEGTDTLFVDALCDNGVELRVATTHACDGEHRNEECLYCERATICHTGWGGDYNIRWADGREETVAKAPHDALLENLRAYCGYVRGELPRPMTRLVDARPFVHCYDLAYVAAGHITDVAGAWITRTPTPDGAGEHVAIQDVRPACDAFLATGRLPSEQGLAWAEPGGAATIDRLGELRHVVEGMRARVSGPGA